MITIFNAENFENSARRRCNRIPTPGFNAEGAEVFAKVAKQALSAFLCAVLRVLCVETYSRNRRRQTDSGTERLSPRTFFRFHHRVG